MKLRNRKTGEIGNLALNINPNRESYSVLSTENGDTVCGNLVIADYNSLSELNEEWEDVPEEPKEYWYIAYNGEIGYFEHDDWQYMDFNWQDKMKKIGNYFETKEEAEKAVEKLKAAKRLKDMGISFKVKLIDRKWYLEPKAEPQQRTFDEARNVFKDIKIYLELKNDN